MKRALDAPSSTEGAHHESPAMLLIGLGNPGVRYAGTRHNVGQMFVEQLVALHSDKFGPWKPAEGARVAWGTLGGRCVVACVPTQPMNLSGKGVAKLATRNDCSPARVVIVHDDLDLQCGRLKIKQGGSSGGHKGIDSCTACLRSADFHRLRIGIGRPARKEDVPDFVLEPFTSAEWTTLVALFERLAHPDLSARLPELCTGSDAVRSQLLAAVAAPAATPALAPSAKALAAMRTTPAVAAAAAVAQSSESLDIAGQLPNLAAAAVAQSSESLDIAGQLPKDEQQQQLPSAPAPKVGDEVQTEDGSCEPRPKRQQSGDVGLPYLGLPYLASQQSWGAGTLYQTLPSG